MLYIGKELKERMKSIGLTAEVLADKTFLELEDINRIIENQIAVEDLEAFDISMICNALHCKPEYFTNEAVRERDLLVAAMNRGYDNKQSINVKIKVQDFMNDFTFINKIL